MWSWIPQQEEDCDSMPGTKDLILSVTTHRRVFLLQLTQFLLITMLRGIFKKRFEKTLYGILPELLKNNVNVFHLVLSYSLNQGS